MMTISKLSQHNSDKFCEPVPELSRKLQLEHHQCIRLLKAAYGLVNAPRRWYHRVATDLRNLTGEESVMEACLCTFRDENGVIHALCLVYVDDFMIACSDSPFGKHIFESINILYKWRKWESRVFKQCGAQITQAYRSTLEHGRIRDQLHRIRKRDFDHHFAITSTPRQEIQNHTT